MKSKTMQARVAFLGCMVLFGVVGLFRRGIPLPSGFIAMARGFLGAGFIFAVSPLMGKPVRFRSLGKKLPWLCLTGGIMGFNWILLFEAYNYTTVATATLCYYLAPTLVTLAAPLVLKERLTLKSGICAAVALLGMVLVSGVLQPDPAAGSFMGILFGIASALLYAAVILMNKKLDAEEPLSATAVQLLSAAVVTLPYVLLTESVLTLDYSLRGLLLLAVVGILITGVAYILYFSSMRRLPAQSVAMFSYLDPVVAVLCSALILREPMDPYQILGAVLILGGALVSEWKGRTA